MLFRNDRIEGLRAQSAVYDKTVSERKSPRKKSYSKEPKFLLVVFGSLSLTVVGAFAIWRFFIRQPEPAILNPFTASVIASTHFPLYYPTSIPSGYSIDPKSVNEPQQGVVVFDLVSSKNAKIYMSEEARPDKFSPGNFYARLTGVQEVGVSDGAIATGYDGLTLVASRANNKTWLIANTNASLSRKQLITLLQSITLSY